MIYLLDVNALLALGVDNHEFHERLVLGCLVSRPNRSLLPAPLPSLAFFAFFFRPTRALLFPPAKNSWSR